MKEETKKKLASFGAYTVIHIVAGLVIMFLSHSVAVAVQNHIAGIGTAFILTNFYNSLAKVIG